MGISKELERYVEEVKLISFRSSKLFPIKEDIAYLVQHGYSNKQILDYVTSIKKIDVKLPTLISFIRKHILNEKIPNKETLEAFAEGERGELIDLTHIFAPVLEKFSDNKHS